MNWDDVRFALALVDAGSLAKAAKALGVDHTTVGRRVEALEAALGARLFTRTPAGYVPTADADRLLGPMRRVEEAIHAVERRAVAQRDELEGKLRVTSPETLGVTYLAPILAELQRAHPKLVIDLVPAGEVLDLGKRQAELAVRLFRSAHKDLVVRRAGAIGYGLYASHAYLEEHRWDRRKPEAHPFLSVPEAGAVEATWLRRICPTARVAFTSTLSIALHAGARASAGIAVLPRYLGDRDPSLRRLPMPDEPTEPIWLTIHRDLQRTPRIRALFDFLVARLADDALLLRGAP
ncbi:MAG: LysR family transcriptional regulator [Polyangiaceae bacterium]